MSPAEVTWRARDQALRIAWSRRQVSRDQLAVAARPPAASRAGPSAGSPRSSRRILRARVPAVARAAVVEAADRLLRGEWEVLGVARTDLKLPDWFADPVTGRRAPSDRYAFRINHRSQEQTGNIKQVWEISRLQHLTVLATAWFLTGDEAYALRVDEQLRSWWRENPFLSGVHWTSGIEIGIRLISLAWIRRLLADWPGAADLFERNELAVQQIRWHQQYLAAFRSRGSSANNHVIAEAAGQLVASCAFPWFAESGRWRQKSARLLERELARNTFPSGIGRELASDYQCFVAELGLLAAVEAEGSGLPAERSHLAAAVRNGRQRRGAAGRTHAPAPPGRRRRGPRAAARRADGQPLAVPAGPRRGALRPARLVAAHAGGRGQHDHRRDDGRPAGDSWQARAAPFAVRRRGYHPAAHQRAARARRSGAAATAARTASSASRRTPMPTPCRSRSATAGSRSSPIRAPTATTASPSGARTSARRSRTTPSSSTGRTSPATAAPSCGCGMRTRGRSKSGTTAQAAEWTAEHDGYLALDPPARHRRRVRLDRAARTLDITDEIDGGGHEVRLAFHLGPDVQAELDGTSAVLRWPGDRRPWGGAAGTAARAGVEPAPRRDRTHPRLVLWRPRASRSRSHAPRPRTLHARYALHYTAEIP